MAALTVLRMTNVVVWLSTLSRIEINAANDSSCTGIDITFSRPNPQIKPMNSIHSPKSKIDHGNRSFFFYAKSLFAAALGIEILCIGNGRNR